MFYAIDFELNVVRSKKNVNLFKFYFYGKFEIYNKKVL